MKKYIDRIVTNPKILTGKPTIKGTRIPVDLILEKMAQGIPQEEILIDFPRLTQEDIRAVLYYAKSLVDKEEFYPLPTK